MALYDLYYTNRDLWIITQKLEAGVFGHWSGMIQRCTNPNHASWPDYGGRGITVCPRWLTFYNFWADMGIKPGKNYTIERLDNEQGYSPENCKWASMSEQMRNTRIYSSNVSGVKGVSRSSRDGWRATAVLHGKQFALYTGPSYDKAVAARQAWDKAIQGIDKQ